MAKNKPPGESVTQPQVLVSPGILASGELPQKDRRYFKEYREMRKDPTIALARFLTVAPGVVCGWSYEAKEGAPEGSKKFIEDQLEKHRMSLMKKILEDYVDFGWSGFEIVWNVDEYGFNVITQFKALLQDYTQILVDEHTGALVGLRNELYNHSAESVDLYDGEFLWVALDYEGTYWYGQALMENARVPDDKWEVIEDAASRYDKKVAGSHWVVHYPMGTSMVDGEEVDNFTVAKRILSTLQSTGMVAVPTKLKPEADDVDGEDAWKIELLSDTGNARAAFVDRQKYLDGLKVRSFGFPERAVLEGEFGTKAEAEAHGSFAIVNMEMRNQLICQTINKLVVDYLLMYNYGLEARGTVVVKPNPIKDASLGFLRDVYKTMLMGEVGAVELDSVDTDTMKDKIGVPKKPPMLQPPFPEQQPAEAVDPVTGLPVELPQDPAGTTTGADEYIPV